MARIEEQERPTIVVARSEAVSQAAITEVLLGIEEESIPYKVITATGDARQLAHQAAVSSRLAVGIGAAEGMLAVTTEKLPEGSAYLEAQLNLRKATDRAIGANAARIVKRMPLMI